MAFVLKCELYCFPVREAMFVQIGWWPDIFACAECKEEWESLCEQSERCVENRKWFRLPIS